MNILLINHYAGSPAHGMEFRPYYFAREWVRAGHDVRILASGFSHVRAKQPVFDPAGTSGRKDETIDGIRYHWYPTPSYRKNGAGRVWNIWSFLRQVWMDTPRLLAESMPDAVIASSTYPLDIWVAKRIARLSGSRLIYEIHDLWPMSPIELGGMSPLHPFILLCQSAENAAYRHADAVVSMLPNVHDHVSAHGLDLKKLHIVPNGIFAGDWTEKGPEVTGDLAEHLEHLHKQGRTVVGYAGAHGLANALDSLLDAAKPFRDKPVNFVLVGDGQEKARLRQRLQDEEIDNVTLFDPVPKTQIGALLASFDICHIGLQKQPLFRFGISPNKLMDYMMAAKPVICAIEAGNDMVRESGCGLSIPPEDPEAIVRAVRQLLSMGREKRLNMGYLGRNYVMANHDYRVLTTRFLNCLQ